jgi:hypothetical protein
MAILGVHWASFNKKHPVTLSWSQFYDFVNIFDGKKWRKKLAILTKNTAVFEETKKHENVHIIKGCQSNRPLPNWQRLCSWHKTKCQSCPDRAPLIMRGERRKVLATKTNMRLILEENRHFFRRKLVLNRRK